MSRFSNLEFDSESESVPHHEIPVEDGEYFFDLATKSFEHADFEAALRYYSKVLEFNLDGPDPWNGQVRALIELGEFREAKLWSDKALERFPDDAELLASKAVALARCGDTDGALAYSDASIEQRGNSPYIWLARGDVFLAREEPRATSCFERAQTLAPEDWLVAWLTSRIQYYYEKFAQALTAALTALKWNPGNDMVWIQAGHCQWKLSLNEQARNSFQQARDLNPKNSFAVHAINELNEGGKTGAWLVGFIRRLFSR